ncbi:MAG: M15 family metallopeptidase [Bacillota bacterium]|nr:M15 family metallopeptidase [Bacillota bacterium]
MVFRRCGKIFSVAAVLIILGLLAYLVFDLFYGENKNGGAEKNMDELDNQIAEEENLTEKSVLPSVETGEKEEASSEGDCEELSGKNNAGSGEEAEKDGLQVVADGDYLLALVTKDTILKSDYEPVDLVPVLDYMHPSRALYLRQEAMDNLEELWKSAEEEGVILHIISAYRSFSYQEGLFQSYADKYGVDAANRFSARPGQSEHQLGTVVDFGGTDVDLKEEFADTDQGHWLAENAHFYGFALSYPRGGEATTGYIFEPWHYRYIGREAAEQWKNSGKILQEFLQEKPQDFE